MVTWCPSLAFHSVLKMKASSIQTSRPAKHHSVAQTNRSLQIQNFVNPRGRRVGVLYVPLLATRPYTDDTAVVCMTRGRLFGTRPQRPPSTTGVLRASNHTTNYNRLNQRESQRDCVCHFLIKPLLHTGRRVRCTSSPKSQDGRYAQRHSLSRNSPNPQAQRRLFAMQNACGPPLFSTHHHQVIKPQKRNRFLVYMS